LAPDENEKRGSMTTRSARPPPKPKPPAHLRAETRKWFAHIECYILEEHHIKMLLIACESWDRCVSARETLDKEGLVYFDRLGNPRARPEVRIENDNRILFLRAVRELDLDAEVVPEPRRPPAIGSNRRA
jgi:phage terminase small subunit